MLNIWVRKGKIILIKSHISGNSKEIAHRGAQISILIARSARDLRTPQHTKYKTANPASFEAGLILFYSVFPRYPERKFNHRYHQDEEKDEIYRHYFKAYRVSEETEDGRDECRADIGARHLYSDYSAGVFRPEVVRRGVNDARIYRRAAEAYYYKRRGGEYIRADRDEQAAYAAYKY